MILLHKSSMTCLVQNQQPSPRLSEVDPKMVSSPFKEAEKLGPIDEL